MEDWIQNLPLEGLRPMCTWERFIELVREPLVRKVGPDAFISVDGVPYCVEGELINCEVTVWYGPLNDTSYSMLPKKTTGFSQWVFSFNVCGEIRF